MIKKRLFPLGVLLVSMMSSGSLFAQCGLVVDIEPIPRAHICLGESVDLRVKTNLSTPIPSVCAINTDKTCGLGSDSINTSIGSGNIVNTFNSSAPELFGDFGEAQSRSQIIILASELQATGFNGGKLTSLAIDVARLEVGKNHTIPNFSIKIGCTSANNFTSAFLTGLDEVYAPRTLNISATGEINFLFDNAYDWDGVGNLVIEFCYFTPAGTSASAANLGNYTRDHVPGFAAWRQVNTPSSSGSCSMVGTEKNFNQRPNIKFNICRPKLVNFTYAWTPNNGSLNSVTSGRPTATPVVDTRYIVSVTKIDDPGCTSKDTIDIVVEDPSLFTPSVNTPTCVGTTLQFNANTSGVTYFWSGPNGFQSFDQNPAISNVTIAASGTYIFQVDKGFCKATKTIDVIVQPIPNMGTAKDSTVCRSTPSVVLSGLLTGEDPGGTWLDDNASGILTGGSINPSLLVNSGLPATFKYTYRIINSCGTFTNSVRVTVIPTKSPGIADDTTICETGSAINLFTVLDGNPNTGGFWTDNNASGQVTPAGIFTPTNLGGGTYNFDYTVVGTSPCPNTSATVTVKVSDQPYAGTDGTKNLCVGASANLFAQLTGSPKTGGSWSEVTASGGVLNASSGDYSATGVAAGVYQFRYVVGAVAPCIADTALVTVTVYDAPRINSVVSTCSPSQQTYTVQFQITGGQPSTYSVSPAGTISGTTPKSYTSNAIPDATQVTFTVSDAQGCGTATTTVLKRCACPTQAGTVATSPALQVCNNGTATVVHTGGYVSDGNDTVSYVLHTNPTTSLGTIIAVQSSPVFAYQSGIVYGTTYYVSAVAGNRLPNNLVDFNDQCLSVSVGVPIKFGNVGDPSFTFSTNPACPGSSVSLTGSVTAGSPSYSWTGPNGFSRTTANATINPITAASAGTYALTVSSNGCSLSVSDVLDVVATPVVTITSDASVCQGQGAKLNFNVTAPAQINYTYLENPGTAHQIILNPGLTTITVFPTSTTTYTGLFAEYTGPNGCSFSMSGSTTIQVVAAPVLTYSILGENTFCFDEPNSGVIQFQITPPVAANVTYTVNDVIKPVLSNVNNGNTISFAPQINGVNNFRVESATLLDGSCPLTISGNSLKFYKLIEPIVQASVNKTTVCDNDSLELSFSVLASERVAIRYMVNFVESVLIATGDTTIKLPITGNTAVEVMDASYLIKSSCGRNVNQFFNISSIPSPDPDINITHTACNNVSTGSIVVTTPDANDRFSLNGGGFSSDGSFTQLTSGVYQLVVRSLNGCEFKDQIEIIAASNLVISTPVVHTSCGKNDGEITISILSGTSPYNILFNGNPVGQGSIPNLAPGNYSVLIVDGNNCVKQNQVTVKPSSPISIAVSHSNQVDCVTPEFIQTFITPSGGSGIFTYKMDANPPQTDSVFQGLYPQTHRVVVSDDRGCMTTKDFLITAIQKFSIDPLVVKAIKCFNGKDGEIRINTTDASLPALYSRDNITYQSNNVFTEVGAGTFTIYVRENAGCRREQKASFSLSNPDPVDLEIESFGEPNCFNSPDGFVQLDIVGGTPVGKTFTSNGGLNYQSNPVFSGLLKGNYVFVAQDEKGCPSDTIKYMLNGPPDIVISGSFVFAGAEPKVTLTIEATGGQPGYLYSIDGVNYFTDSVFTNLIPSTYIMYVMDANNCVGNKSIWISGDGVSELEGRTLRVYPNPFRDELQLTVDNHITNIMVQLYNAIGEKVFEVTAPKMGDKPWMMRLPNDLAKGVYTLQLDSDQGRVVRKLINE